MGEREVEREVGQVRWEAIETNTVIVELRSSYAHSGLVVYATALYSSRLFLRLLLAVEQLILTQSEREKKTIHLNTL